MKPPFLYTGDWLVLWNMTSEMTRYRKSLGVSGSLNDYTKIQWVIVAYRQLSNFSAILWLEQVNFQWNDDELRFGLDQHA